MSSADVTVAAPGGWSIALIGVGCVAVMTIAKGSPLGDFARCE